jgi:hypothetical protein
MIIHIWYVPKSCVCAYEEEIVGRGCKGFIVGSGGLGILRIS